jgi:hypothetical protein
MQPEEARRLEQQVKLSRMLSDGFMFSIIWLGGIGSLIALIKGLRAMRIIRQSNGQLTGANMAWWCIIAGVVGIVMLPLLLYLNLTRYIK